MSRLLLIVALLLAGLPAQAATYPVDDSASQVLGNTLQMKWDELAPRRGQRPTVSGAITVQVRLQLAPWKGRSGRVYMTLPPQPSGPTTASWTSQGRLLPGTLRAGERTLVYVGVMPDGMLEDTLRLVIRADGERLVRVEQLHFAFEIDVESP